MRIEFYIDGHLALMATTDCVPPPGSHVVFEMQFDHPKFMPGAEIRAMVRGDKPTTYVFPDENDPLNPTDPVAIVTLEVISSKEARDV